MTIAFGCIQDAIVIVRHGLMFKQCKVYHRKGFLYAAVAGGFVKLRSDGVTTHSKISWEDIEGAGSAELDKKNVGYLEYDHDTD